jgi:superfamily II DNA helicase RecQ
MSLHCFAIPALRPEPAQGELNAFLAGARVLSLQRELVADGASSFWAICVEVADGPGPLPQALRAADGRRSGGPIDYKQILSPEEFDLFAALRDWRKQAAQSEGLPLYSVFSNEQLAEIARRRVDSKAALAAIEGIGAARVAKYGEAVLRCVARTGDAGSAEAQLP